MYPKTLVTAALLCCTTAALSAETDKLPKQSVPIPHSLFPFEDSVHVAMLNPSAETGFQLSYDCTSSKLYLDFIHIYGQPDSIRLYPEGKNYSPAAELTAEETQQALSGRNGSDLAAICNKPKDYRRVLSDDRHDTVIDINDIYKKDADPGQTSATVFYVYRQTLKDLPYGNPYSVKAENTLFDCLADTDNMTLKYGADLYHKRVTDAAFLLNQTQTADPKLKQAVCQPKAAAKLPRYTFAPAPETAAAAPQPLEAAAALVAEYQIDPPKYRISKITTEGSSVYQGKKTALSETLLPQPTGIPNIYSMESKNKDYTTKELSFMGWPTLWSNTDFDSFPYSTQLKSYSQDFSWRNLPENKPFKTVSISETFMSLTGKTNQTHTQICRVTRSLNADELHRNIKGRAKEIQCHDPDDTYKRIITGYWLEDYHYLIFLKTSPNAFYYSESSIKEFE